MPNERDNGTETQRTSRGWLRALLTGIANVLSIIASLVVMVISLPLLRGDEEITAFVAGWYYFGLPTVGVLIVLFCIAAWFLPRQVSAGARRLLLLLSMATTFAVPIVFGAWAAGFTLSDKFFVTYHSSDKFVTYHKNGQKKQEVIYKEGKPDGHATEWYESGQKHSEGIIIDYQENGLWTYWYENGQKESEVNWKDGEPDGLWISWHKNGQKKEEVNYKEGLPDGLEIRWHENGQKREEVNWKEGKPDRLWIIWHENGQKEEEIHYKEGKLDGLKTFWDENGNIIKTETYSNGELVK